MSKMPVIQTQQVSSSGKASGVRKYPALRLVSILYYVLAGLAVLSWIISLIFTLMTGMALNSLASLPGETKLAMQIQDDDDFGGSLMDELNKLEGQSNSGSGGGSSPILFILFMMFMTTVGHAFMVIVFLSMAELIKLFIDVQSNTQMTAVLLNRMAKRP